jgi:DNA modification methylase
MTPDIDLLELLPDDLKYQVLDDISRVDDAQSVLARKQRRAIEVLRQHTQQGRRPDKSGDAPCTSDHVQVDRPSRRANCTEKVAKLYREGEAAIRHRIAVLEAAEEDPAKWGDLLQEMDNAGSPERAFQHLRTRRIAEQIDEDSVPDPGQAIGREGDLWQLGDHWLMCGDCTNPDHVARLFDGEKPHLMVTDQPYGVQFDGGWRAEAIGRRVRGSVPNDDRADWTPAYALFPGDVAYVFHSKRYGGIVLAGLEGLGFEWKGTIAAATPHFALDRSHYHSQHEPCFYVVRGKDAHWQGGLNQSDVWRITRVNDGRDERTDHGTQKPVVCMRIPIVNSSEPGDAVYDPFVGSGTTITAAEIEKRRCYGMDIDPVYCTIAIERWRNFTGRKAVLVATGQTFEEVKAERSGTDHHSQETP